MDRLTEGPNSHVQKVIRREDVRAGVRGGMEQKEKGFKCCFGPTIRKIPVWEPSH